LLILKLKALNVKIFLNYDYEISTVLIKTKWFLRTFVAQNIVNFRKIDQNEWSRKHCETNFSVEHIWHFIIGTALNGNDFFFSRKLEAWKQEAFMCKNQYLKAHSREESHTAMNNFIN
jgi:hypothetical protein